MKLRLYSVYDKLMGVYLNPFPARADVEATRQLKASMDDPQLSKTGIVTNPGDYDLVHIATFDDETGIIESAGSKPTVLLSLAKLSGPSGPVKPYDPASGALKGEF